VGDLGCDTQPLDFAIIWDEDRKIEVVEPLYFEGALSLSDRSWKSC